MPPDGPPIRAILFDFGRVISAQKPPSLFRRYECELGLPADSINRIMFDSPEWQDTLLGRKTEEEFWRAVGPRLNLRTPEEIDAFRRRYRADEALDEGVATLIHRLRGRYRLAVLSNHPPGLSGWLAEWGILDRFDVVFCSGDEGIAKPDPAAFRITLERLRVAPEEAVFIDDTPGHVAAARALGMHGLIFTTAEALERDLEALEVVKRQA